jgi:predicted MFS family arabinose efflux permease
MLAGGRVGAVTTPATEEHAAPVAPDRPGDRARYREVLGVPEFRVLFAAYVIAMLGNVIAAVALTVLVYQQTRSAALAASVMALSFLPYLIGGVLLGAAVDRLQPRRALVICELASAGLVGCMVITGTPLAALLGLLFATGLIAPVYQGVRSAVLPEILPAGPPYILGRSLMRLVSQTAQIAGYGAGGLLLAVMSPRAALLADAIALAASALLLRLGLTRRPAAGRPRSQTTSASTTSASTASASMAKDSMAGLRAVLAHRPTRRVLLFGWLIPACSVAPEALAAPYATLVGQPARAAGFLLMGIPIGTVLADGLAARLLTARQQRRIIAGSALACFVPLLAFAARPGLVPALALLLTAGLGSAYAAGMDGALIEAAPPQLRNRALALSSAGLMFTQGVGFALWGVVGQYVPLPVTIPLAAVVGCACVAFLRPVPQRRHARSGGRARATAPRRGVH